MPSEITGPSSVDRVIVPPTRSSDVGGTTSSRAVVRVTPVRPQAQTEAPSPPPSQPLGRSGLNLHALLSTTDLVAERASTGNVALDVGLETARSSLLRNLPGDALAALDQVWSSASRTEDGWYLRSGALMVLGLPGESDRVADDGLVFRPSSSALRFVQALSRLALGDVPGARATLSLALQQKPNDPMLLVMHALILAKQGDQRGAVDIFSRIQGAVPDHPALTWGRVAMRSSMADVARQQSRPTPADWPASIPDPSGSHASVQAPDEVEARDHARPMSEVVAAALERFGGRVATAAAVDVAREARMLLRAFSAGGTLASSTSAEQAHAARMILSAFTSALGATSALNASVSAEAASPLRTMVSQLIPLLQQSKADAAERVVRKQAALAREPIGRLLMSIIRGAALAPQSDCADVFGNARIITDSSKTPGRSSTPAFGLGEVRDEPDRGPIVPIRLGLGLLDESSATRKLNSGSHVAWNAGVAPGVLRDHYDSTKGITGRMTAIDGVEIRGEGWGAARATSDTRAESDWSEGASVRAVALVCVVLAAMTLMTGHAALAIGLAVGAAWLGLRRSGRDSGRDRGRDNGDRPVEHADHNGNRVKSSHEPPSRG